MTHWCQHLLADSGCFYALKGVFQPQEAEQLADCFQLQQKIKLVVPQLVGERHLIVIAKNNEI